MYQVLEEANKKQLVKVAAYMEMATKLYNSEAISPYMPLSQEVKNMVILLSNASRTVRLEASSRLSQLIVIQTRANPIFYKLYTKIKKTEDWPAYLE